MSQRESIDERGRPDRWAGRRLLSLRQRSAHLVSLRLAICTLLPVALLASSCRGCTETAAPANRKEAAELQRRGGAVPRPPRPGWVDSPRPAAKPDRSGLTRVGRRSWLLGAPLSSTPLVELAALLKNPEAFKGKPIKVRGRGRLCGAYLALESGQVALLAEVSTGPAKLAGEVTLEGTLSDPPLPLEAARAGCEQAIAARTVLSVTSALVEDAR